MTSERPPAWIALIGGLSSFVVMCGLLVGVVVWLTGGFDIGRATAAGLSSLQTQMGDMSHNMQVMSDRIGTLPRTADLITVNQRIDSTDERVNLMDTRLRDVETAVAGIKSTIAGDEKIQVRNPR